MESATTHQGSQKDGFPQLCEQRDNTGHIEVDDEVCSRKTSMSKH